MRLVKTKNLPQCCIGCYHQESAEDKWGDHAGWYCSLNMFMPTKNKVCKRKPTKQEELSND